MNCPECGKPMHHFMQPSYELGKPDLEQAECLDPACDYYKVTLPPSAHLTMTPERRESYLKINRQIRARHALRKAQEDELNAQFVAAGLNRPF